MKQLKFGLPSFSTQQVAGLLARFAHPFDRSEHEHTETEQDCAVASAEANEKTLEIEAVQPVEVTFVQIDSADSTEAIHLDEGEEPLLSAETDHDERQLEHTSFWSSLFSRLRLATHSSGAAASESMLELHQEDIANLQPEVAEKKKIEFPFISRLISIVQLDKLLALVHLGRAHGTVDNAPVAEASQLSENVDDAQASESLDHPNEEAIKVPDSPEIAEVKADLQDDDDNRAVKKKSWLTFPAQLKLPSRSKKKPTSRDTPQIKSEKRAVSPSATDSPRSKSPLIWVFAVGGLALLVGVGSRFVHLDPNMLHQVFAPHHVSSQMTAHLSNGAGLQIHSRPKTAVRIIDGQGMHPSELIAPKAEEVQQDNSKLDAKIIAAIAPQVAQLCGLEVSKVLTWSYRDGYLLCHIRNQMRDSSTLLERSPEGTFTFMGSADGIMTEDILTDTFLLDPTTASILHKHLVGG